MKEKQKEVSAVFGRSKEKKLWNHKEYAQCRYCFFSTPGERPERVLCQFHGEKNELDKCRRFRYDPTRRKPHVTPDLPKFDAEDFQL